MPIPATRRPTTAQAPRRSPPDKPPSFRRRPSRRGRYGQGRTGHDGKGHEADGPRHPDVLHGDIQERTGPQNRRAHGHHADGHEGITHVENPKLNLNPTFAAGGWVFLAILSPSMRSGAVQPGHSVRDACRSSFPAWATYACSSAGPSAAPCPPCAGAPRAAFETPEASLDR